MNELQRPSIRHKSPRKVGRPSSDLISSIPTNSSATPPPPLPPRPNSMVSSATGPDPISQGPLIPRNYYPPQEEQRIQSPK